MEGYRPLTKAAKEIMERNKYMAIATIDANKKPWVATVFYAYGKDYTFYFLSPIDSRHAENIRKSPDVSFAIFDSRQPLGESIGIQAEGTASIVQEKKLEEAIEVYANRLDPDSDIPPTKRYPPEDYSGAAEFRFFKIVVSKMYLTGTVNRRTEVDLSEVWKRGSA